VFVELSEFYETAELKKELVILAKAGMTAKRSRRNDSKEKRNA
jgi:hypothetical protein